MHKKSDKNIWSFPNTYKYQSRYYQFISLQTNNNMDPNTSNINYNDLQHMLQLLQMAESPDNQAQAKVYQTLKSVEQQPLSYIYLAILFANQNLSLNLRKLAGLMMSSALKRNRSILHFQLPELSQLKTYILSQNAPQLQNIKSMIASILITRQNFDYHLFNYLIQSIETYPQNISMIHIILEDVKYSSENYNIFIEEQFVRSLELIYTKIFNQFGKVNLQTNTDQKKIQNFLKCLNLITFHCPTKLHNYLRQYLESIIKNFLLLAQKQPLPNEIIVLTLLGLNQIIGTKSSLLTAEIVNIIINFNAFQGNNEQIKKCWTNIMIQMIQNDEQSHYQNYLPAIIPKVFEGLTFTLKDLMNIKEDMQLEYNPYSQQSEQREQPELEEEKNESSCLSGYTLRKVSFHLLDKISFSYSDNLWSSWSSYTKQKLQSQNILQCQTAISFIASIVQTCSESMSQQIQHLILYLIQKASINTHDILRVTSIWALQKFLPTFELNYQVVLSCLNVVFQGAYTHNGGKSGVQVMMVQQASISLLNQILERQNIRNQLNCQITQNIIKILVHGLNIFQGRALISICKAISTIFQSNIPEHVLTPEYFQYLINELNKKREANKHKDSIVCPIMECLITACESKPTLFAKHNHYFFKSITHDLHNKERVAYILRCIDFMSSIINHSDQTLSPFITAEYYLAQVYQLLHSEQKQIKHFSYGLVSDLAKKYNISNYVQKFVQAIAQTMDDKNFTSLCNALTSLTDILTAYSQITGQFTSEVMEKVAAIIAKQKLELVFALNFARLYGRLSLLNPQHSKIIILRNTRIISAVFLSLRTRQVLKITSDAFRGLLMTLALFSYEQLKQIGDGLGCVLDAMICYPVRRDDDRSPQNQQILLLFAQFTKHLYGQLGHQNWLKLASLPIFLPASIKTLQTWLL